jgi:hypothetical protein
MTKKSSTAIGAFLPDEARTIKRRVLGNNRQANVHTSHTGTYDLGWHHCILLEDLSPATNPLTCYTQAEASIIFYEPNVNSLDMRKVAADTCVITNRSPYISFMEGDVVLVRWVNKEWTIAGTAMKRLQAVMQADLAAAIDTKDDPSTAPAKILLRIASGDLKLTNTEVTIVNRFKNISVRAGTYVKIEDMSGEWQLYNADCPGDSSFSSSEEGSSSQCY